MKNRDFRLRVSKWGKKLILQKKCYTRNQMIETTYWRDAKLEDFDLLEQYSLIYSGDIK
jgi:hypothetical protein